MRLRENEDESSCANLDGMWMVRSRTQTLDLEPMTHSHPSPYVRATGTHTLCVCAKKYAHVFTPSVGCSGRSHCFPTRCWLLTYRPKIDPSTLPPSRRERIGLCSVIRHVSGTSYSCHAAENHAILKGNTTQSVVLPTSKPDRCRVIHL